MSQATLFDGRRVDDIIVAVREWFLEQGNPGIDDCHVLRLGENLTLHFEGGPVVRVARQAAEPHIIEHEVRVARLLDRKNFPTTKLDAVPTTQPVDVLGVGLATVWTYVPAGPPLTPSDTYRALGKNLRTLHALDTAAPWLRGWDPLRRVPARLERLKERPGSGDAVSVLSEAYDQIRAEISTCSFERVTLIHGDAHAGNIYSTPTGSLLLDWEESCFGPPEWDLVTVAMATERFDLPAAVYSEFVGTYGVDVRSDPTFRLLKLARELTATSWLSQNIDNPRANREFQTRIASLKDQDDRTIWAAL